jgi:hypothetical protein
MGKKTRQSRNTSQMTNKYDWIVLVGGLIVVVALVAFVVFRSSRTESVAPASTAATPAAAAAPAADHDHGAEASIRRITAVELRAATEGGQAAVIDVRDLDSYAAGHIAGAMHIPLSFIESQVAYLPRDKMLVTYCT